MPLRHTCSVGVLPASRPNAEESYKVPNQGVAYAGEHDEYTNELGHPGSTTYECAGPSRSFRSVGTSRLRGDITEEDAISGGGRCGESEGASNCLYRLRPKSTSYSSNSNGFAWCWYWCGCGRGGLLPATPCWNGSGLGKTSCCRGDRCGPAPQPVLACSCTNKFWRGLSGIGGMKGTLPSGKIGAGNGMPRLAPGGENGLIS